VADRVPEEATLYLPEMPVLNFTGQTEMSFVLDLKEILQNQSITARQLTE